MRHWFNMKITFSIWCTNSKINKCNFNRLNFVNLHISIRKVVTFSLNTRIVQHIEKTMTFKKTKLWLLCFFAIQHVTFSCISAAVKSVYSMNSLLHKLQQPLKERIRRENAVNITVTLTRLVQLLSKSISIIDHSEVDYNHLFSNTILSNVLFVESQNC